MIYNLDPVKSPETREKDAARRESCRAALKYRGSDALSRIRRQHDGRSASAVLAEYGRMGASRIKTGQLLGIHPQTVSRLIERFGLEYLFNDPRGRKKGQRYDKV
jgi:hypothetical protein